MKKHLETIIALLTMAGSMVSLTIFANLAGLQPPTYPAIEYVVALLSLGAAMLAWEWTRKSRTALRRRFIVVCALLSVIGLLAYLFLYSLYVEPIPGTDERIVRGYRCTAEALLVYGASCPDLPTGALADAQWDTRRLWTRGSVTVIEFSLVVGWFFFMAGFIAALGSIVAGRKG
ncbi:MAG: hypothetical protein ACFBQW_01225 [Sphingomonadaceae bacterium]